VDLHLQFDSLPSDPTEVYYRASLTGNLEDLRSVITSHPEFINCLHKKEGMAALHVAAKYGHCPVAVKLLEAGAEVDLLTTFGMTALHIAAGNDRLDIVQLLLSQGAKVDILSPHWGTALHIASGYGYTPILRELLKGQANPDIPRPEDGSRALHCAVSKGTDGRECLVALLETKPLLNARNNRGETAIHLAVLLNLKEMAGVLVDNGADFEMIPNCDGYSAIHLAALLGRTEILSLLLKKSKDLKMTLRMHNRFGENLLHLGVRLNQTKVCEILLGAGADPNEKRGDGLAAIHLSQSEKMLPLLMAYGCDIHQLSSQGVSALDIALSRGDLGSVNRLLTCGGDWTLEDRAGGSPVAWISETPALQLRLLGALKSHGVRTDKLKGEEREKIRSIEQAARILLANDDQNQTRRAIESDIEK
jgi:ankyrin repeat protein